MSELNFSQKGFSLLNQDVEKGKELMEEYNQMSEKLKEMVSNGDWEGESQKEFYAFLDLIQKYHKSLLNDCLELHKNYMGDMQEHIDGFPSAFSHFNTI